MRWRDQSGPTRTPRPDPGETRLRRDKRPRIGVLVDSLRKTYQTTLLAGISEVAYQRDVDIVVFAGGVLGAPTCPVSDELLGMSEGAATKS